VPTAPPSVSAKVCQNAISRDTNANAFNWMNQTQNCRCTIHLGTEANRGLQTEGAMAQVAQGPPWVEAESAQSARRTHEHKKIDEMTTSPTFVRIVAYRGTMLATQHSNHKHSNAPRQRSDRRCTQRKMPNIVIAPSLHKHKHIFAVTDLVRAKWTWNVERGTHHCCMSVTYQDRGQILTRVRRPTSP